MVLLPYISMSMEENVMVMFIFKSYMARMIMMT